MLQRVATFFLFMFLTFPAHAEEYVRADWTNLLRTLLHFNTLDLSEDVLVDDYAIAVECDLYKAYYSDDFKWNNEVRPALRDAVQKEKASYPVNYRYAIKLQLDRYDFKEKLFRFTDQTTLRGANTLKMLQVSKPTCGEQAVKSIPTFFRAMLNKKLFIPGLPLEQKEAEALLHKMQANKNYDRIINARIYMRIVNVMPFLKKSEKEGSKVIVSFSQIKGDVRTALLDAHVDVIEFYRDEDMTDLIYTYKPE